MCKRFQEFEIMEIDIKVSRLTKMHEIYGVFLVLQSKTGPLYLYCAQSNLWTHLKSIKAINFNFHLQYTSVYWYVHFVSVYDTTMMVKTHKKTHSTSDIPFIVIETVKSLAMHTNAN